MFNVTTIIGARPQFIKCSVLSRLVAMDDDVVETLVHTGQHYDAKMSDIFFDDLGIRKPDYNLGISGGSHGAMTACMLENIEKLLLQNRPDALLVYGDTNSTLAGALAATKLHIPVIHVEAGLRSFNRRMPEEINRVMTDHVSSRLYCPTKLAVHNLELEGVSKGVLNVGDLMYDATLHALSVMASNPKKYELVTESSKPFCLCTIHRAETTDCSDLLKEAFAFVDSFAKDYDVLFPIHPRTRDRAKDFGLSLPKARILEPLGYFDLHGVLSQSELVLTDSGGLQKEAYFHRVPCITLRDETEWVETIDKGWNRLWKGPSYSPRQEIMEYGTGNAGDLILKDLKTSLQADA